MNITHTHIKYHIIINAARKNRVGLNADTVSSIFCVPVPVTEPITNQALKCLLK